MKKIISLFLCLVSVGMFSIMGYATNEETTAVELEINVNNRYTNINEMDEYDEIYLDIEDEKVNPEPTGVLKAGQTSKNRVKEIYIKENEEFETVKVAPDIERSIKLLSF